MGKTVLTFGEIMMRLSPKDHLRIEQATEFDVRYGGAEANTALSLAYQGDKAAYVSVVPANRLGECALRSLKACLPERNQLGDRRRDRSRGIRRRRWHPRRALVRLHSAGRSFPIPYPCGPLPDSSGRAKPPVPFRFCLAFPT